MYAFLGSLLMSIPATHDFFRRLKESSWPGEWWLVFENLETALAMEYEMQFVDQFAIESINKALTNSAYVLVYQEITERLPVEQSASVQTALRSPSLQLGRILKTPLRR